MKEEMRQKSAIQHPKVVVIGAGSLFFGRQSIWQMVHSPYLNKGTLALVDTDAVRLNKMMRLAELVITHSDVPLALEGSTNREDVLKDADFVVLSFAERRVHYRGFVCKLSAEHGIRMCSGDTIGPGGVIHTLRELPMILRVAADVERLCPDAWVINYVNPTAVQGMGLATYAPRVKSFALCDSLHMPYVKRRYAVAAGITRSEAEYTEEVDRKFDLRMGGVNHFTWMLKAEYEGIDLVPRIAAWHKQRSQSDIADPDDASKASFNDAIICTLYDIYGYLPVCIGHTKEYLRFWQGLGRSPEPIPPLMIWDPDIRQKRHDDMWQQVDDLNSGKIPISAYRTMFGPDPATDIIETMIAGLGKRFYINTYNRGAVSNMPNDAFLELLCDIDMDGPRPLPLGEMPRGIRGLQEQLLDAHALTAEGVVTGDYALLRRALMTDPLISSIADADAILQAIVSECQDVVPPSWLAESAT